MVWRGAGFKGIFLCSNNSPAQGEGAFIKAGAFITAFTVSWIFEQEPMVMESNINIQQCGNVIGFCEAECQGKNLMATPRSWILLFLLYNRRYFAFYVPPPPHGGNIAFVLSVCLSVCHESCVLN